MSSSIAMTTQRNPVLGEKTHKRQQQQQQQQQKQKPKRIEEENKAFKGVFEIFPSSIINNQHIEFVTTRMLNTALDMNVWIYKKCKHILITKDTISIP